MLTASAKTVTNFLKLFNFKKLVEKSFQHPVRTNKPLVKNILLKDFIVIEFKVSGKSVVTLQPKNKTSNIHILFFHGGAYLLEGSIMHWKICEKFVNELSCRLSYFDYPLAPEHTYRNTFDMVQLSYNRLINEYPNDKFILMGDSAGGGLALAFAQKLVFEKALYQPQKIILFSPWLDISMQNPDIKTLQKFDQILPLRALIEAGSKYAGGDDLSNYLLSPLNGELATIGQTIVFYGTHELFYPDCIKLREKTKGFGNFIFREFALMQHDWVILPIPEAAQALNIAVEFIKD